MSSVISPELYRRFKDEILRYTNSRQRYESGEPSIGLSDAEIAKKLGITLEEAVELRCVAELDVIKTSRFFEADAWKQDRFEQAKPSCAMDSGEHPIE